MTTARELLETLLFERVDDARQKLETMRRSGEILRYVILSEDTTPTIKVTLPNLEEVTIGQI